MEGRKRSVSILEPDDDVQYYNGDKSLHTLQKLQRFYQERGFDTRGPNEEVLTALVATCRQLIDVNKTQATELSQLREEVKACREETGALSIVTAEQIKDDREQVIRRASRRLSRISRRQSAMTQPAADENEASERRHTSEKDTSFSVSSPPPQAPMGNADREEPFTSEAALPEGLQEEAIIEAHDRRR
ncbi:hypothetical protein ADEAN_000509100 [Angomonas deanei]|uniref:Uncharacterized protein n=1 Tax=Angomonas deanei TaxID=59799 RepID=A0A7G2CFZ2_9TRYP|nr:hypothetical protein ADEAN_000509100 [Angomonas deanei]